MAAGVLARLAHYTGERRYADAAHGALEQVRRGMEQAPLGFAHWLSVLDFILAPPQELALVGDDLGPLLEVVRAGYRPEPGGGCGGAAQDEADDRAAAGS